MSDLRIGVDARPLCHPGTGIYRYTHELLLRMCSMGARWYFYSPQRYDLGDYDGGNIVHNMANIPTYLGGSQASQLLFPHWLRRHSIDTFWGTRHHLPLFLPKNIRTVLTIHDLVWQKHAASMRTTRRLSEQILMPRSIYRADKIVTSSVHIASELTTEYPRVTGRLSVVSGAGSHQADTPYSDQASDRQPYFLFVGTMEPRKNLPRLLTAYRAYLERCDTPKKLKVVGGNGWGEVDPQQLVSNHALGDMVEIKGRVSDGQLSALYTGAYALLMPSIYEGFGLPVIESLAHGVPAIVSRDSALSEVAGMAGYAIDPLSIESICDALCALTLEHDTYTRLRKHAPLRALNYDWDRSAASMYTLLRDSV